MKRGFRIGALGALLAWLPSVAGATVALPTVPEPSGLALFAAGAAAVAVAVRAGRGR